MNQNWIKRTAHLATILQRLGECLQIPTESAEVHQIIRSLEDSTEPQVADELKLLSLAGTQLGFLLAPSEVAASDAWELVAEGFPILIQFESEDGWLLLAQKSAWRIDAIRMMPEGSDLTVQPQQLTLAQLRKLWGGRKSLPALVAQSSSARMSSNNRQTDHTAHQPGSGHGHSPNGHGHHHHHHGHMKPIKRLISLLRLELRDIWTLTLFALVAGVLGLATPLAVESLVNTVAWGTYLQPLFVLSMILFGFLSFAGMLKLLQFIIVEIMQRRLFVRIVGDLVHRFPMARRDEIIGEHPSELANRYFDIMTIQKSTATLVLDGISIVLQTTIGLILLAFYHPFLLGFDIVLLILMTVCTFALGRGGVRSAIEESKVKYEMAHWLQDVISCPTAFRLHGGWGYAADRANRLTVRYLADRQQHFQVLARQVAFSLILLAVASTALLGIGGWLVIRGELTLGQLVASELVVTAIVGAFAKIGKSLESYYDLMAAVDKVGHMLDLNYDPPALDVQPDRAQARVRWQNVGVAFQGQNDQAITSIEPGQRVAITGPSGSGKTRLLEILAGLRDPESGFAEICGIDCREASRVADGRIVALARQPEIFCGSLLENVRLGRKWLTVADVRRALEAVGLWEEVLHLPEGIDTVLQTGGYPLNYCQSVKLTLARASVALPAVLLVDGLLDLLDADLRHQLWQSLHENTEIQTIIIATHDEGIRQSCDTVYQCVRNMAGAAPHNGH